MKKDLLESPCPLAEKKPADLLHGFVDLFASKGWLNHTFRIRRGDRRYRICCSEEEFFAYRINDHCDVLPGFPGWPVCIVTSDEVMEDLHMSGCASAELGSHGWLRCIAEGDFELL